jgi:hypothetical protein
MERMRERETLVAGIFWCFCGGWACGLGFGSALINMVNSISVQRKL